MFGGATLLMSRVFSGPTEIAKLPLAWVEVRSGCRLPLSLNSALAGPLAGSFSIL